MINMSDDEYMGKIIEKEAFFVDQDFSDKMSEFSDK